MKFPVHTSGLAVRRTAQHWLAEQDARGREWDAARQLAFLLAAFGGFGLANAELLAPAAYWAAWADALPVMLQRRPEAARRYAQELALGGGWTAPCPRAAAAAGDRLLADGWSARLEWDDLLHGARPPPTHTEPSEPGSWPHGCHKPAARVLNTSYHECLHRSLSQSSRARHALPGGRSCRRELRAIPTDEGTQLLPLDMQVALGLRLPLPLSARCGEQGCRAVVDQLATIAPPAPGVGCWPGGLPYSSEHGFASRGKPSLPRGGWSPNNGWRGPLSRA